MTILEELEQLLDLEDLETDLTSATTTKIEEEQALIIKSDNPQEVFDAIRAKKKFAFLVVGEQRVLDIEDKFFDTKDEAIKSTKSSLRIRKQNGELLVTMKGKNKSLSASSYRSELEVTWPWANPSPFDVVELFGMEQIAYRKTHRVAIDLLEKHTNKLLKVAELCLDRVTFFDDDGEPTNILYEVEVEMQPENAKICKTSLTQILGPIRASFPELQPWKMSKFATGKVINLIKQIEFDEDGVILPSSYDALRLLG